MGKVVAEKHRNIDFSGARRGPVVKIEPGKTKISIRLDNTVLEYFRRHAPRGNFPQVGENFDDISPDANALASAVQTAGIRIFDEAQEHPERQGMGSTIVALFVREGKASIAHIGDSRVYLLRDGQIRQLTADHSLVMEQVRRGLMTVEEAERSSMQNIIGVEWVFEPGQIWRVHWFQEPFPTGATWWYIGTSGYSEIGTHTVLGV
jgi:hypothetical protein